MFILYLWGCVTSTENIDFNIQVGVNSEGTVENPSIPEQDHVFQAQWNEDDGIFSTWSPATEYQHVELRSIDGTLIESMDSLDGKAEFSNLDDGEYLVSLHVDRSSTSVATIHQLVGSNRLLYRSEMSAGSSEWGPPTMQGSFGGNEPAFGMAMDIWGEENIGILAGGTTPDVGILIADVDNPAEPKELTTVGGIGFVRDVKSGDGLLFTAVDAESDGCLLCDDIGVRIFDFADPENPILLSTIGGLDSAVHNLSYSKGFLYLCSMIGQELVVYDVRDPSNPVRINTWTATADPNATHLHGNQGGPHDITAIGDRLYVAHVFGFSILDISDPYRLIELGSQEVYMGMHNVWPNDSGDLLIGSQEIAGGPMTLWDISDPQNIQQLYSLSNGDETCIHNAYFRGDTIFAAWYVDGAYVFELDENGLPEERGHYDTYDGPIVTPDGPNGDILPPISGAWGVWAYGDHILVGDTNRGLIVLDYIPYSISTPF